MNPRVLHFQTPFSFDPLGMFLEVADIVHEINPNYEYPNTLVSTIMLACNHQVFYAQHLPSLTNIKIKSTSPYSVLNRFIEELAFSTIAKKR